ncbi:MAG: flavin reductase [Spirochaetia bacterium]|jgi:flavin reductase (DIM6/NTAB) family NADH-FMN oxidoreductase RutF|nr:flavin reductase [Spirochaetia bacterium]
MFAEISVDMLELNPFSLIGKDNFLLTVGGEGRWNTMTGGWGSMGFYWGKPSFTVAVRQSRYTWQFMEENDSFTVSFLPSDYAWVLSFCGSHSGRETDKARQMGIEPIALDNGMITFDKANLVFCCTKVYQSTIDSNGFSPLWVNDKWYGEGDYHTLYTGSIDKVFCSD